jgi:hypothetical protein
MPRRNSSTDHGGGKRRGFIAGGTRRSPVSAQGVARLPRRQHYRVWPPSRPAPRHSARLRCAAGKCRISSRASASVRNVITVGNDERPGQAAGPIEPTAHAVLSAPEGPMRVQGCCGETRTTTRTHQRPFMGVLTWIEMGYSDEISCKPLKYIELWRRGRDSNPRYGCPYAAFRVRCIQPLCHLSKPLNLLHDLHAG